MAKITYYFDSKNNKALRKITTEPLFQQIIDYLTEQPNVILRQLKAAFENEPNFDVYLDQLIEYNLLERKNRRYTVNFPIFSTDDLVVSKEVSTEMQAITQDDLEASCLVFGEWLWPLFFEDESYFFGVRSNEASNYFLTRTEAGNESLTFVSITTADRKEVTTANYFSLLIEGEQLPERFKPLEKLIGDVDINYFILQCRRILRSLKRQTGQKQNIFLEALITTKELQKTEQKGYYLNIPLINCRTKIDFHAPKLEAALLEINALPNNQRVFYKKQLYCKLFNICFPERKGISYLIK
ncbi:DUF1803 domain-containing protein [Erwinia sp. CPCC 100877]|nr:DUF1803 domain-containing protein [Erwinia sp. CPCC 100877]